MANLAEAKSRFREAQEKVSHHQMYEGRSTRSGSGVYLDAYDAARYYISALEEKISVHENAEKEDPIGIPAKAERIWRVSSIITDLWPHRMSTKAAEHIDEYYKTSYFKALYSGPSTTSPERRADAWASVERLSVHRPKHRKDVL